MLRKLRDLSFELYEIIIIKSGEILNISPSNINYIK